MRINSIVDDLNLKWNKEKTTKRPKKSTTWILIRISNAEHFNRKYTHKAINV